MAEAASQLRFSAELLTMLTAAAGLVLVALRADLTGEARWARGALAAGFTVMASVAFVHGSLLVNDHGLALGAGRLAGYVALAAGTLRWPGRRVPAVLGAGLAVSAAAAVTEVAGARGTVTDALLIAGSVLVAGALVAAGRRSIVARVAASAAATLLVVVLVLSIALSAIISSSAQSSQLAALASRARIEASMPVATVSGTVRDARFFAADLAAAVPGTTLAALAAGTTGPGAPAAAAVSSRLALLAGLYPVGSVGYVAGGGSIVTPGRGPAAALVALAAHQPLVAATTCRSRGGTSGVTVMAGTATSVAAYPECELATSTLLGVVVVAAPLDASYLTGLRRSHPGASLSLVTPTRVLAAAGPQPPADRVVALAARALADNRTTTGSAAGRYLAVVPLSAGTTKVGTATSLVVSTTDAAVVDQQDRMEKALYLIALGGTLIALLFVAAVGDRITVGLRRLTQVAQRVRRGSVGERVAMSGVDEVGTLGAAFDSMMTAVEAHTVALRAAAEDETRLRNRLEAVVAGMGDALVATDASGLVTDFNAAAEVLIGVGAEQARGRAVADLVELYDDAGARLQPLKAVASNPRPVLTGTLIAAGGGRVPVAASVGALEGPAGERAGSVLVMRDLRREQELERMKSEFLSRIGHELRTPLTAIIGYADLLLHRGASAAQASRWHEEIRQSAGRLQRVVELLEFVAASEGGRLTVNAEALDPRELAREVVETWSPRLRGGMQLQRRVARDTPAVRADRRWLTLAVNELIDNAVKFSPAGGRVALTARPAPGNGAVDISVTDKGLGMDSGQAEDAFAEFVQGDSSDTRRYGGLGLGLALVTRVARAHGGSVLCESAPGHGSTFTIRLPARSGQTADT